MSENTSLESEQEPIYISEKVDPRKLRIILGLVAAHFVLTPVATSAALVQLKGSVHFDVSEKETQDERRLRVACGDEPLHKNETRRPEECTNLARLELFLIDLTKKEEKE